MTVARFATLIALLAFGLAHWMVMLDPAAIGRAIAGVGIAGAMGFALTRVPRAWRAPVFAAALLLALLAGGVPLRDLAPGRWDDLGAAIANGIEALPGARVPYQGLDEDLRMVIGVGGTLLAVIAAALACWPPERRLAALIALVGLYTVPAVSLFLEGEFLRGAVLALLVIAYLRPDRLEPRAAALAAGAAVLALAVAPALDSEDPWWDYEAWAQDAAGARSTVFDWDHDYGALRWPRDGRELIRVSSRQRAYWKTDELGLFDGTRWRQDLRYGGSGRNGLEYVDPELRERWTFDVRVTIRNLRSTTLPVAGVASAVDFPDAPADEIRPGIWGIGRDVRRGDAYRARVYVPQPAGRELATAGDRYVNFLVSDTAVETRAEIGGGYSRRLTAFTRGFGEVPVFSASGRVRSAGPLLRDSQLARTYALARRLVRTSETPYDYVRAIQRQLVTGYGYSEEPPETARTLEGFLFDAKIGFCQQFSGSMALLLRLGGVPARVATGFAPGFYDRGDKEYVVRDYDAHSWVEAWFPEIGWVVFDPTPTAAPPRSQALINAPSAGVGDVRDLGTRRAREALRSPPPADPVPWSAIGLGALLATALALVAGVLVRRRPHAEVLELERALRAAREPLAPQTTLVALEARLPGAAARYVSALRAQRYAPAGVPPTAADRRGLRRALVRGRSPLRRARTWLALPPRVSRR